MDRTQTRAHRRVALFSRRARRPLWRIAASLWHIDCRPALGIADYYDPDPARRQDLHQDGSWGAVSDWQRFRIRQDAAADEVVAIAARPWRLRLPWRARAYRRDSARRWAARATSRSASRLSRIPRPARRCGFQRYRNRCAAILQSAHQRSFHPSPTPCQANGEHRRKRCQRAEFAQPPTVADACASSFAARSAPRSRCWSTPGGCVHRQAAWTAARRSSSGSARQRHGQPSFAEGADGFVGEGSAAF